MAQENGNYFKGLNTEKARKERYQEYRRIADLNEQLGLVPSQENLSRRASKHQ